jgi:predicted N-acetyltransferase YhbS
MNAHVLSVDETTLADADAIETLLDLSFGLSRRTKSSYRLREGNTAIPGLSLVVRDAEFGLSGTISFWPLKIGEAGVDALLLGPLAVHPARQNLGIGLALMREGVARAKRRGHKLMLLVGDAPYYARVGFQKLPENQLLMPGAVDADRFLYLELEKGALDPAHGLVLPPHRFAEKSMRSSWSTGSSAELLAMPA